MKKIFQIFLLIALSYTASAQTKGNTTIKQPAKPVAKPVVKPAPVKLNALDSASYGFGTAMGTSLKSNGLTALNYEMLIKGLKDTFSGTKGFLTQEQAQAVIQKVIAGAAQQKFFANIAEGKAFMEQNKKQAGIMTTASGIQYLVLTQGTGVKPSATDTVLVHYSGTLLNGFEFDSSYKRGEPISFSLNQVIAGWTEAVQLMPTGSKYRFYIPYNLAYGERGAGEDIPPYSTLIFDIELLKVSKK